MSQWQDNGEILEKESNDIDTGLLSLTYCHNAGIIPLMMSRLLHQIVCCSKCLMYATAKACVKHRQCLLYMLL